MSVYSTSVFIREYGMTMMDISQKYGISKNVIYRLHYQGKLRDFIYIKEQELNRESNHEEIKK